MSDAEPTRLLGSVTLPSGADRGAVERMLQSSAGIDRSGGISSVLRGDSASLSRAAGRCATALGVPVKILDIAGDAGRVASAAPGADAAYLELPDAALIPSDAGERRRRCDAVVRALGIRDRAAIADLLGDLADRPASGRDVAGDRVRAAAFIDAIQVVAERASGVVEASSGEVLIVAGQLAAWIASGAVPFVALAPVVSAGRTTVLLDHAGVLAALGTEQLSDEPGVGLVRAVADQLLTPAGDLLRLEDFVDGSATVELDRHTVDLQWDAAVDRPLAKGEALEVTVSIADQSIRTTLYGGAAGIGVVRGAPVVVPGRIPEIEASASMMPIEAPLEILPRSASATGGLGGRLLLGDEVEGRLYYSPSEPDSRGWAAAQEAGILAVVAVSPETVLRARAVGIRGIVVGSLSDGEREALSASIDRRVAAGVALAPFGLLILGGRRERDEWTAAVGTALQSLNGSVVRLERQPAGLVTAAGRATSRSSDANVLVIGGPRAGASGTWRGLADPQSSDPRAAIEINGVLVAIPLGDLQRLTA